MRELTVSSNFQNYCFPKTFVFKMLWIFEFFVQLKNVNMYVGILKYVL